MINRYSQPIQHQYMPTQPDTRLTLMMMQKRSADQAKADQEQASLENEILGAKAYGEEDKAKLNEISLRYQDQLSEAYDNYKDDPNALSQALHGIRRNYDKEKLSGELYNINRNYGIAMKTRETADKALLDGKISQYGYDYMLQDPVRNTTVAQDTKPLELFATKISSTDFADSVFNNPKGTKDALNNAMIMFDGLASSEYQYMNEDQKNDMRARAASIFYNKYRNTEMKNAEVGDNVKITAGDPTAKDGDFKGYQFEDAAFDEQGNFSKDYTGPSDEYTDWNPLSGLTWDDLSGVVVKQIDKDGKYVNTKTTKEYQAQVEEVKRLADVYGIDPKNEMSDKAKAKAVEQLKRQANAHHQDRVTIDDDRRRKKEYTFPDINTIDLTKLPVTIDGKKAKTKDVDKLFGKIITDNTGKYVSERPSISPLTGELFYPVKDGNGKSYTIGIQDYDQNLSDKLKPYQGMVNAIEQGAIGKGAVSNVGGYANIRKDNNTYTQRYNQIEVIPVLQNGQYRYQVYHLDDGVRLQTENDKGKPVDSWFWLDSMSGNAKEHIDKAFQH